ncbi:MAG: permease-like cell division protein FtsX [Pseudomonadota bacterium]
MSARDATPRGASRGLRREQLGGRLAQHRATARESLLRLLGSPLSSFFTAAVIAIALALPAALSTLVDAMDRLAAGWGASATEIAVYLDPAADEARAEALAEELDGRDTVAEVEFIHRAAAMASFRDRSGLGDVLDTLEENPLPHTLVLHPALEHPEALETLRAEVAALDDVDQARLDREWLERLHAILELGRQVVAVLAALLALGVLLIIGNTIRLAIENRREEITIIQLIGATDAFVRRPFLYTGIWFGLGGGLLAIVLVNVALGILHSPARDLASLYDSSFRLGWMAPGDAGLVLAAGAGLGLVGAWFEVGRHLRATAPR